LLPMVVFREPPNCLVCPMTSRSGCLLLALLAPPLLWRVLTTSRPVREVTPTTAAVPTLAMLFALPATAALEL
jgi:hypothetical protein